MGLQLNPKCARVESMKDIPLPEGFTELSEEDQFAFTQIYRIDAEIEQLKLQRREWEKKLTKVQEI